MPDIPLISEDDMISSRKIEKTEKRDIDKGDRSYKKPEKPVRILRIKYHNKITFPFMENGKVGQKDAFAVDRSLEELLRALYYNIGIQGNIAPSDCIFVEKDNRMSSNNKFIFIEISRGEFDILKRQLENDVTVCAYNKGELLIMEGKRSSLAETFNMPRILRMEDTFKREISDTNVILMRARLREELKNELSPYHSYTDEQIDGMREGELVALKRLTNRKMTMENKKRKKMGKLLKRR